MTATPSSAVARARTWLAAGGATAPDGVKRREWFAMGDPQASFDTVLAVLARHDLLAPDGSLRAQVGLVSMGDHFDYADPEGPGRAREHGLLTLAWLASHPPDQVVILAGNHDLARVQELAFETDETFVAARVLASRVGHDVTLDEFHTAHPRIPTPELVIRDFSAFTVEQRKLVQRLFVAGRLHLGAVATLPGMGQALLTHAGVTTRELAMLGVSTATPTVIAPALSRLLRERVAAVRDAWSRGTPAALDLEPVHAAGIAGREGHGLCYHRPSDPSAEGGGDKFSTEYPRRYDPSTLPLGLTQVVGHVGHKRCLKEMPRWSDEQAHARARGGIRTLTVDADGARYRAGILPPTPGAATMYFTDPEMAYVDVEAVQLMRLHDVPFT